MFDFIAGDIIMAKQDIMDMDGTHLITDGQEYKVMMDPDISILAIPFILSDNNDEPFWLVSDIYSKCFSVINNKDAKFKRAMSII